MIKLNVSAANIAVEEKETLTEGRVGLLCQFRFTGEWAGLAKTAVFDGADSRDVILKSDTVAIPAECLSTEGYSLSVGVYGKNAAGDIVIPTVYATVGKIQRSAYPSGKETAAPTPDVVAQIQQAAANAEAIARSVRDDADLGRFAGPAGEAGGWYTPEIKQPIKGAMVVNFTPSKEGMPAAPGKNIILPQGETGETGGYYTPAVTQPDENTLRMAFTPSKDDMPDVAHTDITLPGGGGVQPDWNQNDDTAQDYVKNRPFYKESRSVTAENVTDAVLEGFPVFAIGDTVTVNVDGVKHSLVAYDDDGMVTIGDPYSSIENGEEGQLGWQIYVNNSVVNFYAKEAHTVSFYSVDIVYHTIDSAYLPTIPTDKLPTIPTIKFTSSILDSIANNTQPSFTVSNLSYSEIYSIVEKGIFQIKDSSGHCYSPIRCSIKSSGDIFVEILVIKANNPMTYAQLACNANNTRFYRNAWWQIEATKK